MLTCVDIWVHGWTEPHSSHTPQTVYMAIRIVPPMRHDYTFHVITSSVSITDTYWIVLVLVILIDDKTLSHSQKHLIQSLSVQLCVMFLNGTFLF